MAEAVQAVGCRRERAELAGLSELSPVLQRRLQGAQSSPVPQVLSEAGPLVSPAGLAWQLGDCHLPQLCPQRWVGWVPLGYSEVPSGLDQLEMLAPGSLWVPPLELPLQGSAPELPLLLLT